MLDHWFREKKSSPAWARFPHRYVEKYPYCQIQPQKKVPPARSRFPHTPLCTEIPLFKNPAPKKTSPGLSKVPPTPRYVTPRHITPCHVSSRHVASRHVTPRRVTTSTMNCNVPVWGCCTGIIVFLRSEIRSQLRGILTVDDFIREYLSASTDARASTCYTLVTR